MLFSLSHSPNDTFHTAHSPHSQEAAGRCREYEPISGNWSKVRGAQEGGSVSACSARNSPGQSGARQGSGSPRNTRTGWCLIPRQDRTISPSSINNLSKSRLHESRHIRNYSGQAPFSHPSPLWIEFISTYKCTFFRFIKLSWRTWLLRLLSNC